jgi:hypothetical protein
LSTGAPTFVAPNNAVQNFKTVVGEWKMSPSNPNLVDPSSYREIISFGKNANNHNGGTITFGKDGYLYIGLGDGGNANDVGPSHIEPGGNAQNLGTPLGKMLRIDPVNPVLTASSTDPVSSNGQYRVPVSNPAALGGQVPEIYAMGFRNPYRFSVDRLNGQIIVADVGQNNVEEINRLQAGGNYGWAIKEGTFLFNRTDPDGAGPLRAGSVGADSPGSPFGLIDPIAGTQGVLQYDHTEGISITGGFVYRGAEKRTASGRWAALLCRSRYRRHQGVSPATVRGRQTAQRPDRPWVRRRCRRRTVCPRHEYACERQRRHSLHVDARSRARKLGHVRRRCAAAWGEASPSSCAWVNALQATCDGVVCRTADHLHPSITGVPRSRVI